MINGNPIDFAPWNDVVESYFPEFMTFQVLIG